MSEVETPSVQDLIQAALNQDYNHANDVFGNLMGEKMSDALEQEKIAVANQIYNGVEPEEDLNIDDIADETDEELEDDDELEKDE